MLIDAVFPAASEVVMVYAGAVASGAFADQSITLFGYEFDERLSRVRRGRDGRYGRLPDRRRSAAGRSATTSAARGSSTTGDGCT